MTILLRFFDVPKQSYFLFGPRGTGKSTWIRQRHPEAVVIDLLRPEVRRALLRTMHPFMAAEIGEGIP